jgi:ATP-dependent Clp protease ATP-binding subunit ClpA
MNTEYIEKDGALERRFQKNNCRTNIGKQLQF